MKELEALKRLRDGYTNGYYKQFTHSEAKIDEDYNMVLEALTPPTADEVAKALSKEMGYEIKPCTNQYGKTWFEDIKNGEFDIVMFADGTISVDVTLSPKTMKMVASFYENEVTK